MQVKKQQLEPGMEQQIRSKLGKDCQDCTLSPCSFNFCAEDIMWDARLDGAQAGIKIAARNISNPRYADDITLKAEGEEELKSFLMKVKEESEESWIKTQHSSN